MTILFYPVFKIRFRGENNYFLIKNDFFINFEGLNKTTTIPYETIVKNILNALYRLKNNKDIEKIMHRNYLSDFEKLVGELNGEFGSILEKELFSHEFYKTPEYVTNLKNEDMNKLFYLFIQIYYLINFSKFDEKFDLTHLLNFILKITRNTFNTLVKSLATSNNMYTLDPEIVYKFLNSTLMLLDTFNLINFNISFKRKTLIAQDPKDKNQSNILNIRSTDISNLHNDKDEFIRNFEINRKKIMDMFFDFIKCPVIYPLSFDQEKQIYSEDVYNTRKNLYQILLKLKTQSFNSILGALLYSSSEKLVNNLEELKYKLTDDQLLNMETFLRNDFLNMLMIYNKKKINTANIGGKPDKQDISEELKQIYEFKSSLLKEISEKFSRLLLLSQGIFRDKNFLCIFFETFYLIKMPTLIENIVTFTLDTLVEKEFHFCNDNSDVAPLTIIIYFLSKITLRIYNEKSKLFTYNTRNIDLESNDQVLVTFNDKLEMIHLFTSYYVRSVKKFKSKYRDNYLKKDKNFYENFLINLINISFEKRTEEEFDKEVVDVDDVDQNENQENEGDGEGETEVDAAGEKIEKKDKKEKKVKEKKVSIRLDNITLLEFLNIFLKPVSFYFDDNDYKTLFMTFFNNSKIIEGMENVNKNDIKQIEKVKSMLLAKVIYIKLINITLTLFI